MIQQGYILSAIGVDHIQMAHNFAITLKVNQDPRPVCIIVKPEHVGFARDLEFIDFVIPFRVPKEVEHMTDHEIFCGVNKLCCHGSYAGGGPSNGYMDAVPFDQYIMIDTDFLVAGRTDHVWKLLESMDQPVVNFGTIDAPFWHWNHLPEIEKKVGRKLSYTCGDMVYFNKLHKDFDKFIEKTKDVFLNKYDEYGCRRAFGPKMSKTEEVAFAIVASEYGLNPVEMHLFPVINYNPKPGQSYKQFMYPFEPITDKNTLFTIPVPFIHLWDKLYGLNYHRVFFEIINGIAKLDGSVFKS